MEFKISRVAPEDIASLKKIEDACFAQPWSENSLLSELDKDNAVMFAAIDRHDVIVGWAGLEHICGEGSITNVAVLPQSRRGGAGQALVAALLQEAVRLSLDWLMLEVRISNTPAVSLYQKLGFNPIGIRPAFYDAPREDALLMRHTLDN